jgi:hypothetical protein
MKVCKHCLVELPLEMFEKRKDRPNIRSTCKKCREQNRDKEKARARHRTYQKNRRQMFPDQVREIWERSTYGICKSDFNYAECWICGSTVRLCIDHCHKTEKARGLLCSLCNLGLGAFQDNKVKLSRAIEYLETEPHYELDRKVYP